MRYAASYPILQSTSHNPRATARLIPQCVRSRLYGRSRGQFIHFEFENIRTFEKRVDLSRKGGEGLQAKFGSTTRILECFNRGVIGVTCILNGTPRTVLYR